MDVAKIAALLISTPQPLNQTYGVGNCLGQRLPLVLIPTTAGTGSEVTHVAVVTDDKGEKSPIVDAKLIADAVIIDPKLTEKLPPKITATTGIDAMVHAIESYTSGVRKNIISDHLAKQALKFLTENIVTAYHQGDDLEARGNMQMGSMLAGLAFANATVGAVHALSYPLGTNFHIPHGESNALVMMPVLKFNAEEAFQMYAELSMHLFPNVDLSDPHMSCEYLLGQFENILTEVKMKSNLSTYGVTKSDIDSLVTGTLKQDRLLSYNYRKMEAKDIRDCFLKII